MHYHAVHFKALQFMDEEIASISARASKPQNTCGQPEANLLYAPRFCLQGSTTRKIPDTVEPRTRSFSYL